MTADVAIDSLAVTRNEGISTQLVDTSNGCSNLKGLLPRPKLSRSCGLCRQQGHKVFNCPFLEKFAALLPICRPSSKDVRQQLSAELTVSQKFPTYYRDVNLKQCVHTDFPRRGEHDCIIIHRRLFIEKEILHVDSPSN